MDIQLNTLALTWDRPYSSWPQIDGGHASQTGLRAPVASDEMMFSVNFHGGGHTTTLAVALSEVPSADVEGILVELAAFYATVMPAANSDVR